MTKEKFKIDVIGYEENNDTTFNPKISKFSGGEMRVSIPVESIPFLQIAKRIEVTAHLHSSDDIMALFMLNNAIAENLLKYTYMVLRIPYMPYGRQDRICNHGESFSLKVFARLINSMMFSQVIVYDPHSKVTRDLINNCCPMNQDDLIMSSGVSDWLRDTYFPIYLVSPDAGAAEKTKKIYETYSLIFEDVVYVTKVRNQETNRIEAINLGDLPEDEDCHFLVCDDICDYGGTFIELAKKFNERGIFKDRMSLYVTHGIFAGGMEKLNEYYSNIFCYNNFLDYKE